MDDGEISRKDITLKELDHIQAIIGRFDTLFFLMKQVCLATMAAVFVAPQPKIEFCTISLSDDSDSIFNIRNQFSIFLLAPLRDAERRNRKIHKRWKSQQTSDFVRNNETSA